MNKITVLVFFSLSLMALAVSAVDKKCPDGTTWNEKLKGCVEDVNSRPVRSRSALQRKNNDS